MFHGFDFDNTMLRIAAMNLYMHGVEDPDIHYQTAGTAANDRAAESFWVSREEIAANKYDLSINRYKEVTYEEASHDPPGEILARMRALESEILTDMDELQAMLGQPPTNPVE